MHEKAVLLCLVLACALCWGTVGLAEDESAWTYNISMSVLSASGDSLPSPSVPLETIQDGLTISAYNNCLTDNEMTLLLLCGGHVIPFSVGSRGAEPARQTYVTVPAKGELTLTVYPMFDETAIQEGSFLHAVLIGLCDIYPHSEFDYVQGFSTVVSIPVTTDSAMASAHGQPIEEATKPASKVLNNNLFYGMKMLSVNGVERSTALFRVSAGPLSLRYAVIPDEADVYVCCLVDNALQPIQGYDGVWIHAPRGMSYEGEISLSLAPGKHQLYLMCIPLFSPSPSFVTSEKIVVEVSP